VCARAVAVYRFGVGRGRRYTVAAVGLLGAAGVVAWRTWPSVSVGQVDPVSAVVAVISLAVGVVALGQGVRAQRQADTDVTDVAARLAVRVGQAETEARRQLLGGHDRGIDVGFDFVPAPTHNVAGAPAGGTLDESVGYYRSLRPRRMVITGVGGSGKTVLAIELILGLLRERAQDEPVPVRISAALLDTGRPPESAVRDWLVKYLRQTYRLPATAARELVAAGMVLPVLDGLDEMDAVERPGYASRAAHTIRACNAYLDFTRKAAIVLTCRIGQYEALEEATEWVHDAARIRLRPVGLHTAQGFLTRRVTHEGRWRPLLEEMQRPGNQHLARALSTPWRLTLAATVYDQRDPHTGAYLRDPAELASPHLDTENKIRDHLLSLFIPTVIITRPGPYPADRVHHWLGVLANYLDANTPTATRPARVIARRTLSGTDLILHELWPLAGPRAPRALTAAAASTLVWAWPAAFLLAFTSIRIAAGLSYLLIGPASAVTYYAWAAAWPTPKRTSLRKLSTSKGRQFAVAVVGLVIGLTTGYGSHRLDGPAIALMFGLMGALLSTLASGLAFGIGRGDYPSVTPSEVIRADLTGGWALGFAGGFAFGLFGTPAGLGLVPTLTLAMTIGLVVAPLAGFVLGLAGWRYIALLACTRRWNKHWLPLRLNPFLLWCYDAGLVRIAGIGYQFRHRELQDYLARHPTRVV
jgi:hypothetical protein